MKPQRAYHIPRALHQLVLQPLFEPDLPFTPRSDALVQSNIKALTWLTESPKTDSTLKTAPCRDAPSFLGAPQGTSTPTWHCCDVALEVRPDIAWAEPSQSNGMWCG